MKMNEWSVICRIDEIPVLGSRRVERPQGMDVAVFRNSEDQVFAVLDRCPHKGGPLSQGIVFGTSVACARAPDLGCVPKFACKVEGGQVLLDPHELATHAIDLQPPRSGPGATTGALGDQTYQVQAPHGA
jgi:nitrite reductase (NADH) small subunit